MLLKEHVQSVVSMVEEVDYSGLKAIPLDVTPVDVLYKSMLDIGVLNKQSSAAECQSEVCKEGNRHGLRSTESISGRIIKELPHERELSDVANYISRKMGNSLNHASNVIGPLCNSILAKCESEEANHGIWDSAPTVIAVTMRPIYQSRLLEVFVKEATPHKTTDTPLSIDEVSDLLEGFDVHDISKSLLIGDEDFDKDIAIILTDLENDGENIKYSITHVHRSDRMSNVAMDHHALLGYLLAQGIRNGRLEGFDYTSLTNEMRTRLTGALNYYAWELKKHIGMLESLADGDRIVLGSGDRKIFVNGPVYRRWLKKGGSPDAVIGAYLEGAAGGERPVWLNLNTQLLKGATRLAKLAARERRTRLTSNQIDANREVDKVIFNMTRDAIREVYAEDVELKAKRMNELAEVFDRENYHHSMDLDLHVLRYVCEVMAGDRNDAFEILITVREYLKDNPAADIAEAKVVAAAKLFAKWAVSQVELVEA